MKNKKKLKNWELSGYYPHIPKLSNKFPELVSSITDWIPAKVPGSVHYDLWKADWIENPYVGLNSLKCEWVENRWWMYRTRFDYQDKDSKRKFLHFEGLDYKAYIYLNDVLLGIHEGTFIPVTFEITDNLRSENNELLVLFEKVPDEDGQAGYTSQTESQKSRFSYKWDFSTRMVPTGIWDEVYIISTENTRIKDVWIKPKINEENNGIINTTVYYERLKDNKSENHKCKIKIISNDELIAHKEELFSSFAETGSHNTELVVEEPQKWFPNGLGNQTLYKVVIEIWEDDKLSDQWIGQTGFRELKWIQNKNAPKDSLPYSLLVNGERVYIKGVNITPFDMLIGTVTREKYENFVKLIKKANINLVRINGVGLIEKEEFYNLCDREGILIFQEFIQTSSSLNRTPPTNPDYLKKLSENSKSALKSRRNHISLACWSGGNELTDQEGVTATFSNENISLLKKLVDRYDPGRYFIPTSPTGPNEFLEIDQPGMNYDVHGPWNYGGPEGHYNLYNHSDSLLHGEMGVEGMSCLESLQRFLPKKELIVTSMTNNVVWRHHGDWWDTYDRDLTMFGTFSKLSEYIEVSQFVQAEGIRYALESNRRRKYRNSGSIIWAFNEPFPNVSNTSLVDYYGSPKMSYYWTQKAYADLHISLKYSKLYYHSGENFDIEGYIHNSLHKRSVTWKIQCLDLTGNIFWEKKDTTIALDNTVTPIKKFSFKINEKTPEIFMVRVLFTENKNNKVDFSNLNTVNSNEYIFSTKNDPIFRPLILKQKPELKSNLISIKENVEKGRTVYKYRIKNEDKTTALFVKTNIDPYIDFVYCSENYSTLFPGEEKEYKISLKSEIDFKPHIYFTSW